MGSFQTTHRGSYEDYKTRNKVFINWLTETARKCCKLEDVVSALKSRAGRDAKKNGEEVLLTTREITLLCHKVAERKTVKVPDWILGLLKTVIDKRTTAAIFYASALRTGESELERSNAGHTHFIDILQQAYDMFAALDKSRIIKLSKPATPPRDKPLDNLFEHLEVEDLSEAHSVEDEIERRAAEPPRIRFRVEFDDKQETLEQLLCLLSDLREVRMEIEATFRQFTDEEVTYDVACMVASIGFGIIRRACEPFVDERPEFGDYIQMLKFLGLRVERHEALVVVFPECRDKKNPQQATTDTTVADIVRHTLPSLISTSTLCVSGADIILRLNDALQSGQSLEQCATNCDGKCDHCQQRHGFAQILHNAIPELRKLEKYPEILEPEFGSWYGDEFLSGLLNYAYGEQRGLPIWLAVVTQCYRNIYDILVGNMKCGAPNDRSRWVRLYDMMKSTETFKYCSGERGAMHLRDDWSSWLDWIKTHGFDKASEHTTHVLTSLAKCEDPPYGLILSLPTVTSRMAFTPSLGMYVDGCRVANTNLVIQCAAHLYAACLYSGLIDQDSRWRDMDFFLKHHKIYAETDPEADPYSLINHFFLALGNRQSTLAKVRARPNFVDVNLKHLRWIQPSSRLAARLAEVWKNAHYRGTLYQGTNLVDTMVEALADYSKLDTGSKSSKAKERVFSPLELLSVFKRHLIADEPERNFNMVGFSQQCSAFVADLREQICQATADIPRAVSPYELTCSILARTAQSLDEKKPASSTLLSVVLKVIAETIAHSSDKFSKEAYGRSSGHLLPDQKPELKPKSTPRFDAQIFLSIRKCLGKARGWVFEDSECEGAIYQADGTVEEFQRLVKLYTILQDWSIGCARTSPGMGTMMPVTVTPPGRANASSNKGILPSDSLTRELTKALQGDSGLANELTQALRGDVGLSAAITLMFALQYWVNDGADPAAMPSGLVDVVAMGLEGSKGNGSVKRAREWLGKFFKG